MDALDTQPAWSRPVDNRPFPRTEPCPACGKRDVYRLNPSHWEVCDPCYWALSSDRGTNGLTLAQMIGLEAIPPVKRYRARVRVVTSYTVEVEATSEDEAEDNAWSAYQAGRWLGEGESDGEIAEIEEVS